MNKIPLVSIFMPVFNAEKYVKQALASIEAQTYTNWELVVVDDWSEDKSWEILQEYARNSNRVIMYRNGRHRGVASAANLALTKVRGELVARMDADDVMHPQRLAKQVRYLQNNPGTVAVGTQCALINHEGKIIGDKTFPTEHEKMYRMIFRSIPLQQPSLMVNTKLLPKHYQWYQDKEETAEEVDFLLRIFRFGKCANVNEKLLSYRIHTRNTSLINPKKTFYATFRSRMRGILRYQYRPQVKDVLVTFAQLLLVTLLPKQLIYPVYSFFRNSSLDGSKEKHVTKMYRRVLSSWKKAFLYTK